MASETVEIKEQHYSTYFGVEAGNKHRGHMKHPAVEDDLFRRIISHGPHDRHVPVPRV